jgi:serpin B
MRVALGVAGMPMEEVNAGYKSLLALLGDLDPSTSMRIANSVWSRTGFPVEPAFTSAVREYFGGTAQALDFGSAAAPTTINAWVSENTAGKITSIIDDRIPSDVVMYLINAVYFKGTWRDAFDKADTRPEPFSAPGGSVPVSMMHNTVAAAGYHRAAGVTLLELPYGNGAFAMTIAVPDSGASIEAFTDSLTPARWSAWTGALTETKVDVAMPRFRLEWGDSLNGALTALGMGIAFDATRANFTGINRAGGLYVTQVKQKTYVDVNEEGTEAAAATSVGVGLTSVPLVPQVRVDRPFVVALRERLSGSILFLGKITRPVAP